MRLRPDLVDCQATHVSRKGSSFCIPWAAQRLFVCGNQRRILHLPLPEAHFLLPPLRLIAAILSGSLSG